MTVINETINYLGAVVKIAKLPKQNIIIQGSVDGNRYDKPYSVAKSSGFSDKSLLADGYIEVIAGNGGIFYQYDKQYYADGIEVVQGGVNNQDFNMACVSKFNECMSIGFLKNGGMVFDRQINLMNNINQYYSALTFAFGIMKDGKKVEWGKTEHASQYNCISGRTVLGQNDDYIFALSISGTTGKTGLKGNQLFTLCQELGMLDAGCFDGGGSVWLRANGKYLNNTDRAVKNSWLIFCKEKENEEILSNVIMIVDKVGVRIRSSLSFKNGKATGTILKTLKVGEKAEVLAFMDGIKQDGFQWMKVKSDNIVGYAQYDSQCYWLSSK